MTNDVYDDSCQTARIVLGMTMVEGQKVATDINRNCNLFDLVEMAVFKLDDYAATVAVERP